MIRLQVLGSIDLAGADAKARALLRQPRRLALLTYLVLESRSQCVYRDQVIGMFWPEHDEPRARRALNQALYVIRRSLGETHVRRVGAEGIAPDERLWCDAVAFEDACQRGALRDALALYRGELLEGIHPAGVAAEFEHWLEARRASLRRGAGKAAEQLAAEEERAGQNAAAIPLLQRAAALAPLEEPPVRRLMKLFVRRGDHVAALEVYSRYERRLQRELGLRPSRGARLAAEEIRDDRGVSLGG